MNKVRAYLVTPYIPSSQDDDFVRIIEKWMDPIIGSNQLAQMYRERHLNSTFGKEAKVFEARVAREVSRVRLFNIFEFLCILKECHLTRLQGRIGTNDDKEIYSLLQLYQDLPKDKRPNLAFGNLEGVVSRITSCKPSGGLWKVIIYKQESQLETRKPYCCVSMICPWCWWRKYRELYHACKMPQGKAKTIGRDTYNGLGFPASVNVSIVECNRPEVLDTFSSSGFVRFADRVVNNTPDSLGHPVRGASEFDTGSSVLKIFHPSLRHFGINPDLSFIKEDNVRTGIRVSYIHANPSSQDKGLKQQILDFRRYGCGKSFPFPVSFTQLSGIPLDEALYFWAMPFPYNIYDADSNVVLKYMSYFYRSKRYVTLRIGGSKVGRWLEPPSLVGDY